MQNNIYNKINTSSKIICLILLILMILLANSLYLIMFLLVLTILLLILTTESVNVYIDFIKNIKFILLFIFIGYIIIIGNVLISLVFVCKIIMVLTLIKQFILTTSMCDLIDGIKTILKPIKKIANTDNISYNIGLFIVFINTYFESKEIILNKYKQIKYKYIFSLKYNILPRIYYTISKINEKEEGLKLKFYSSKEEIVNKQSKIIVAIFSVLFIVVVFKEVIV